MAMDFKDAFDPFRALRHGIESIKIEPVTVGLTGFLLFLLQSCQSSGSNFNLPTDTGGDPFGGGGGGFEGVDEAMLVAVMAIMAIGCCIGLGVFVVKCFIDPGAWRVGERITIDGAGGVDTLFSGKDAWLSMLGYRLLMMAVNIGVAGVTMLPGGAIIGVAVAMADGGEPNIALIGVGVCLILILLLPAMIYVNLGLQMGNYAISLDRVGTMEALDKSWTLAKGNRLRLFWFNIVNVFASLLAVLVGMMMCCVGIIVTAPAATGIIVCAQSNAYLMFTREDFEDFELSKQIGAY